VLHAAGDGGITALVTWAAIARVRRWSDDVIRQWRADGRLDVVNARTGQVLPLSTEILDEVERYEHGRLDIGAAAARIRVPWLLLHGDRDEAVPVEDGRHLSRAGGQPLIVIPGGTHTFGARHPWQGTTPELDDAMDRTVGWFSEHLARGAASSAAPRG
jgi:pimeloyl-ACP methyl ester carboxylesterase